MKRTGLRLLSKFYTEDNHLIHQIQLLNEESQVVFSQEFRDYADYKATFATLQKQVRKDDKLLKPVVKTAA
jgi:hypothetical protein